MTENKKIIPVAILPATTEKLMELGNAIEHAVQLCQGARDGLPNGLLYGLLCELEHGFHSDVKSLWRVINVINQTGSDAEVVADAQPTKPAA